MPEFQYRNHLRPARRSALRPLQEFVRGGLGLRMARECQPAGPVAADRASWNNRLEAARLGKSGGGVATNVGGAATKSGTSTGVGTAGGDVTAAEVCCCCSP